MATTIEEITKFLDARSFKYKIHKDGETVGLGFQTKEYKDPDGDPGLRVIVSLQEQGEYVVFIAPNVYKCPHDHPHLAAVLETALRICWRVKLLTFEYDHSDGEIRATVRLPLEDSTLTEKQFNRCLHGLIDLIDKHHAWFTRAFDTGEITDAGADEIQELERRLDELRKREAPKPVEPVPTPDTGLEE